MDIGPLIDELIAQALTVASENDYHNWTGTCAATLRAHFGQKSPMPGIFVGASAESGPRHFGLSRPAAFDWLAALQVKVQALERIKTTAKLTGGPSAPVSPQSPQPMVVVHQSQNQIQDARAEAHATANAASSIRWDQALAACDELASEQRAEAVQILHEVKDAVTRGDAKPGLRAKLGRLFGYGVDFSLKILPWLLEHGGQLLKLIGKA